MNGRQKPSALGYGLLIFLLSGCLAAPLQPTQSSGASPSELTAAAPKQAACSDLDLAWGKGNWQAVIDLLAQLEERGANCGNQPLRQKEYSAHIQYALAERGSGNMTGAVEQYQKALAVNGTGREALEALKELGALPVPTPAPCTAELLPPYVVPGPSDGFARAEARQIVIQGKPFYVQGLNYYPRHATWRDFVAESNLTEIEQELELISKRGFNTLRIFLTYDVLFQCAPERAVPIAARFQKLDRIIRLAKASGLHLIVTLNDLPDFYFRPLYTDWERYDAQTQFIVRRYRAEDAILAWDLRNEGDIDYGVNGNAVGKTRPEDVVRWLAHTATLVRAADSNHLLTAGWLQNALETAPYVDLVSFHYWADPMQLPARVQALAAATSKPILVEETGIPSTGAGGESRQAAGLERMAQTADASSVAGWLIWTAFDFEAADVLNANPEKHFGLWRIDLGAKPALDVLPLPTRVP